MSAMDLNVELTRTIRLKNIGTFTRKAIDESGAEEIQIALVGYPAGASYDDECAKQIRDALTTLIGDYRAYDPNVYEPYDAPCTHHVPCASSCGPTGLLQRKSRA